MVAECVPRVVSNFDVLKFTDDHTFPIAGSIRSDWTFTGLATVLVAQTLLDAGFCSNYVWTKFSRQAVVGRFDCLLVLDCCFDYVVCCHEFSFLSCLTHNSIAVAV